jgi:hypothetical protein
VLIISYILTGLSIFWAETDSVAMKNKFGLFIKPILFFVFVFTANNSHSQHSKASSWLNFGQSIAGIPADTPELEFLRAADSRRNNAEILKRLRNLEQICFSGNPEDQKLAARMVDVRILDLQKILEERAQKEDLEARDAPESYLAQEAELDQWPGRDVWLLRFAAKNDRQKCELIELISALTVARLSTLKASKDICGFNDFICRDTDDVLFQKDLKRLRWELRYLASLNPSEIPEEPASCRRRHQEALERLAFAQPDPQYDQHRWPMGRAFGMCGRGMSAHWIDDDVVAGKKETPVGWTKIFENLDWKDIIEIEGRE